MKFVLSILVFAAALLASPQNHDLKPAEALHRLDFLKGDWSGVQDFNTNGGPAMSGKAADHIDEGIGGHYLCEMLSTTMPGRKPTDTRHFISYDAKAGVYQAWWFTDTSPSPLEFEGTLTGHKLVLQTKPGTSTVTLRATYETPAANTLTYTLEMDQGGSWTRLFTTTYKKP
ncbi:MAG TPA: DUF1579 family protein [Fimbriimonadaceae bacterium]|nr:DUF1579 family protein [Fimbriimonadaceae bacterium]